MYSFVKLRCDLLNGFLYDQRTGLFDRNKDKIQIQTEIKRNWFDVVIRVFEKKLSLIRRMIQPNSY